MPVVRIGLSWLGSLSAIALLLAWLLPVTALASFDPSSVSTDSLWAASQATSVDSPFYPIDSWWTSFSVSRQSDSRQRGLLELQEANTDLLNAYTLLAEGGIDEQARPVPVLDPLASGLYGLLTGIHPKAPLGSICKWIGDQFLNLEGRGSTQAILQGLLADFNKHESAAERDLGVTGLAQATVVLQNRERQLALLSKIQALDSDDADLSRLLAALEPAQNHSKASGNNPGNHGQNSQAAGKGKGKKP